MDPFIVENGSAIILPPGWRTDTDSDRPDYEDYSVIVLGKTYEIVLGFLDEIRSQFSLNAKGFSSMDITEIVSLTGLPAEEARLAKMRHFSEPFIIHSIIDISEQIELEQYCLNHGFRLLKGNRFYHLLGDCDKGKAVKKVLDLYHEAYNQNFLSIGLGDSMNDLELLQAVDKPVIIRRKNGSFEAGLGITGSLLTRGIGPDGWQEAIFTLFNRYAVDSMP